MIADPDLNVDAGAILLDLDIGSGFVGKPPGLDQGSETLSNLTASKLAKDSITVALDDLVIDAAVVVTAAPAPETEVVEDVDNADVAAFEDVKGSATDTGGGKITPDNPVLIFPLGLGIVTGLIIGDVFELVDDDDGLATCEVLCVKVVPMNPLEASNDEDVDEAG